MSLLHPHHVTLFSRKGFFPHRASGLQCLFFFFILEGRSRRTIEPLVCGDIIFGSSLTILPKESQTEDLHGGPSLGAAGSNATFQNRAVGKHGRGAPSQQQGPCTVRTTKTVKEAFVITMQTTTHPAQTRGPSTPAPPGRSSDRIWAKRDPTKPLNPGETDPSRLFNCHWPESRPCPQAKVKG